MANYKEGSVTGNKWQRCRAVTIINEYQQVPRIYFQEEELAELGGDIIKRDIASCSAEFNQATGAIPLINPLTGESLGTSFSHQDLYVVLHSLYIQTATARDAAQGG